MSQHEQTARDDNVTSQLLAVFFARILSEAGGATAAGFAKENFHEIARQIDARLRNRRRPRPRSIDFEDEDDDGRGVKEGWKQDYERWRQRDLSGKQFVYLWVDGVHFNVRLEDERSCILVVMGATAEGRKELLAVQDGFRESKLSWVDVLRDLKARGIKSVPALATGDGALGFWAAAAEEFPAMRGQRCWVHKTANVLDKLPRGVQGLAKTRIHDI